MAGRRLFQTRGPATANALSPSDVVVRGMSGIILAVDRARARTTAAGKTEVVGQIAWCSAVQALVNYTFIVYHFGFCLEYMNALFLH